MVQGELFMSRLKIMSAVGARPNFIKLAPFVRQILKSNDGIAHFLVHTGQHYDMNMSRDFFTSLGIPEPDINLEVGPANHAVQIAEIMLRFEKICLCQNPDWVVVFGDVNSALACALTAKKLGLKVAHVEAGLRSFDMTMPEEINRRVIDSISDLLFTHSQEADENLLREGIAKEKIKLVGNIMIDTLVAELGKAMQSDLLCQRFDLKQKSFVYVTLHRPLNVDDHARLAAIFGQLQDVSKKLPVIFPLHPRTRENVKRFGLEKNSFSVSGLFLTEPLTYHESLNCIKNASFIITDSGGLQEESTYLGTPCLTLRPNTERPITLRLGTNKLTSLQDLRADIDDLLDNPQRERFSRQLPLWDGLTSKRIVDIFLNLSA